MYPLISYVCQENCPEYTVFHSGSTCEIICPNCIEFVPRDYQRVGRLIPENSTISSSAIPSFPSHDKRLISNKSICTAARLPQFVHHISSISQESFIIHVTDQAPRRAYPLECNGPNSIKSRVPRGEPMAIWLEGRSSAGISGSIFSNSGFFRASLFVNGDMHDFTKCVANRALLSSPELIAGTTAEIHIQWYSENDIQLEECHAIVHLEPIDKSEPIVDPKNIADVCDSDNYDSDYDII